MKNRLMPVLVWLLISSLGILILSIGVAHLPTFARKLFLVALGFSFLSALLSRWIMNQTGVSLTFLVWVITIILIISGQFVSSFESYKIWKQNEIRAMESSPIMEMMDQAKLKDNLTNEEKEIHKNLQKLTQQDLSFPKYLQWRYSQMGTMKSPAPEITWILEILGTSLLGSFLVFLIYRNPQPKLDKIQRNESIEENAE